jgi:hypothetical protein
MTSVVGHTVRSNGCGRAIPALISAFDFDRAIAQFTWPRVWPREPSFCFPVGFFRIQERPSPSPSPSRGAWSGTEHYLLGCGCGLWLLYSELLLQSGGSFTCGIARRSSSIISILILFVF